MNQNGTYMKSRLLITLAFGVGLSRGQEARQYLIEHPDCSFFGPRRETFLAAGKETYRLSGLTNQVVDRLSSSKSASTSRASLNRADAAAASTNLIDHYLFQAMQDAGVSPTDKTNDFEFIRRATLDLTGRIPTAMQVQTF